MPKVNCSNLLSRYCLLALTPVAYGLFPAVASAGATSGLSADELSACKKEGFHSAHDTQKLIDRTPQLQGHYHFATSQVEYLGARGARLGMTLYIPELPSTKKAVGVLQIHGGGWVGGDRSQLVDASQLLASHGASVVSIDYTLAPHGLFPAADEDVRLALRWMASHTDQLKIDVKDGAAVFGFSAGANLATMLALTAGPSSSETYPVTRAFVVSGKQELRQDLHYGVNYTIDFLGCKYTECPEKYEQASPLAYVQKAQPEIARFYFVHEVSDPVISFTQSCLAVQKLRQAHAQVGLLLLKDSRPVHGPVGSNRKLMLGSLIDFIFQ